MVSIPISQQSITYKMANWGQLYTFDISGLDDEKKAESQKVLLAGHLNLSMVYLKLKDSSSARDHATKAIDMDPSNVKAYFRRGQVWRLCSVHQYFDPLA